MIIPAARARMDVDLYHATVLLERLRGQPVADPQLRMLWALGASAMLRGVADREAMRAGRNFPTKGGSDA
jgi:hypothetical protein